MATSDCPVRTRTEGSPQFQVHVCVCSHRVRIATLRPVPKTRLDTLLVERGLFESRSRAAAAVLAGGVRFGEGGARAEKPGQMVAGGGPGGRAAPPGIVIPGGGKLSAPRGAG